MSLLRLNNIMSLRDPEITTPKIPSYYDSNIYTSPNFGKKKRKTKKTKRGHIYLMAKHLGIKLSIKGRKKTPKRLWSDIYRKGIIILKSPERKEYKYLKNHINIMGKKLAIKVRAKRPLVCWRQINTQVRKHFPIKKQRLIVRKKYSFGNYWDNTQKTYSPVCTSQQCAKASTIGGPYPFYRPSDSNWKPYYQINGNA